MYDPNRPETEEDGIRAEALRRLKVRHQSLALTGRIPASLQLPKPTPQPTESTSSVKPAGAFAIMPRVESGPSSTDDDSPSASATEPTVPVDPAKGNALLKKLFRSKLPIVQDPEPQTGPKPTTER